ncbi:MAG: protein kinase [Archaeoglobaceae archaeon]
MNKMKQYLYVLVGALLGFLEALLMFLSTLVSSGMISGLLWFSAFLFLMITVVGVVGWLYNSKKMTQLKQFSLGFLGTLLACLFLLIFLAIIFGNYFITLFLVIIEGAIVYGVWWINRSKKAERGNLKREDKSKSVAMQISSQNQFPTVLLKNYESVEFLGEGGFAKVFKAKRKSDGKIVALKIPKIDESTSKSFISEVSAWIHLEHKNIVKLYSADIIPIPYLEMEFVQGLKTETGLYKSLEELEKPLDEKLAKISSELLLLYSYPEKIPNDVFKFAMSLAEGHSEIISILPEEAQIRALTLL